MILASLLSINTQNASGPLQSFWKFTVWSLEMILIWVQQPGLFSSVVLYIMYSWDDVLDSVFRHVLLEIWSTAFVTASLKRTLYILLSLLICTPRSTHFGYSLWSQSRCVKNVKMMVVSYCARFWALDLELSQHQTFLDLLMHICVEISLPYCEWINPWSFFVLMIFIELSISL